MQTKSRKTSESKIRLEKKDDSKKPLDEKLKKSVYTVSTPREYVAKTSATDIYAQKKNVVAYAPRKVPGSSSTSNASPMKGLLKSSASSVSLISRISEKTVKTPVKKQELPPRDLYSAKDAKKSAAKNETPRKKELFTNVTVNSPVTKRKLDLNSERVTKVSKKVSKTKEVSDGDQRIKVKKELEVVKSKKVQENEERQRTKTRTLDESEVKILTPDQVDNNAEMINLAKKLTAKPTAFYVDVNEEKTKTMKKETSDEEEVSYEDDFESYESDFDSYHSESEASRVGSRASSNGDASEQSEKHIEGSPKQNDEKMLDSGNYELDARSAKQRPAAMMDFILEDAGLPEHSRSSLEETKRSLDEGFQDMSSSSSVRAVEVLERPLFLDFTRSKQNKLKRKVSDRLTQRAKDLFNVISLHEMTYSLFEMQPISYDLYMATFGRSNYTQSGVQTFDDGITEEIQTDEVTVTQKWTQHPVEFSKHDIYKSKNNLARKYSAHAEDYLSKFTFLTTSNVDDDIKGQLLADTNYTENPLRIFFEQKDGVGCDQMLPYETYKTKLKSRDYNAPRLSKFLKRVESKVSQILSKNTGGKDLTDLVKTGKLPFSKGHVTISPKTIQESKFSFLNSSKITAIFYSDTKNNILLTVHKNAKGIDAKKRLLCLWSLSVAREPMKVLLAIDNILIGKFKGNTDGVFVAALEDGSIHLWDLSEEPYWRDSVANSEKSTELVELESQEITQVGKDREWNVRNGKVGLLQPHIIPFALQSCAYTSSASNMNSRDESDCIVGLELLTAQVVSLQRIGIITIWSIIQEKKTSNDVGKAFWSKIKLQRHQTINLSEHIDTAIQENTNFNLNSAKRRISQRKQDKPAKKETSRPKTASKFEFDIDRPYSAASLRKKVLPVDIHVPKSWENGIVCNDLRIINHNDVNSFLVAKNNGEVLCCRRCLGVLRIERFSVANDTSSITSLDVSSEGIPYFLAASDAGTVSICSLLESRVLLTLDCRNVPPVETDTCQSDSKGRFVSSARVTNSKSFDQLAKLPIKSVHWSQVNHCCIFLLLERGLLVFDLAHSDMCAHAFVADAAVGTAQSQYELALLTPNGEVDIHRLKNEEMSKENLHLFNKYVSLL